MKHTINTFRCTNNALCDASLTEATIVRDAYGELECPNCGDRCVYEGERPALWASVAVAVVARAYGGAEEGGWYYDDGIVEEYSIRNFEAADFPVMEAYIELLKKRAKEDNAESGNAHTRSAVQVQYEKTVADFPTVRPRYC